MTTLFTFAFYNHVKSIPSAFCTQTSQLPIGQKRQIDLKRSLFLLQNAQMTCTSLLFHLRPLFPRSEAKTFQEHGC